MLKKYISPEFEMEKIMIDVLTSSDDTSDDVIVDNPDGEIFS